MYHVLCTMCVVNSCTQFRKYYFVSMYCVYNVKFTVLLKWTFAFSCRASTEMEDSYLTSRLVYAMSFCNIVLYSQSLMSVYTYCIHKYTV